ncbi:MAG: ATP-binding protein, partial [Deltaproteobacteria bacterium]
MVMNLLDISRSEDGALTPHKVYTALDGLCTEIVEAQRIRGDAGKLALEVRVEPGLCANVDRDLLRRVIENLLDNALRHTPPGGHVAIEAGTLTGGGFEIRVRDDGNGIPTEQRDRVFEKYSQLDASKGVAPGFNRGLGLLFCKLAVEAHEGAIRAEANHPKGTVFVIVLPG